MFVIFKTWDYTGIVENSRCLERQYKWEKMNSYVI